MSFAEVTDSALTLPYDERSKLLATLLKKEEGYGRQEVRRRLNEIRSGKAVPIPHEEAVEAARRAIRCA